MYDDLLRIEPTGLSLEAGRLLVSTPYFNDPFFNHSVVLLTDYEEEHTAGLIINRQLPHTVYDVVNEIRVDDPIYFGGPVLPEAVFYENAKIITVGEPKEQIGNVAICTAGTTDIPVAEEAALTAWMCGAEVHRYYDVGVAGIHRLLDQVEDIRKANAIVAVAGMEGALASVIGGLVNAPVVACPTSVGYGANFGGLSALLAMLNSCAAGTAVVNIDNGFGAGFMAAKINRQTVKGKES